LLELGTRLNVLKSNQYLALFDLLSIAHPHFTHDAALQMANGLAIVLNDDDTCSNSGARQGCERHPNTDASKEHEQHDQPHYL
jgi:hypothetical protein